MKKIAIMQPYLFPYIGYWQLINATDEFVFFDVVQYNKKSWMNRNRIINPGSPTGCQYFTVPMSKHLKGTLIQYIKLNNNQKWKQELLGKLSIYKFCHAPNYQTILTLVQDVLDQHYDTFVELCIATTTAVCQYIGIDFTYRLASTISFDKNGVNEPGDWALTITKALGYKSYVNPHGGYAIFDEDRYTEHGVGLQFLKPILTPYRQNKVKSFLPGLSILDLLMFIDVATIKSLIETDFQMLSKKQMLAL